MYDTPRQAADRLPLVSLERAFAGSKRIVHLAGDLPRDLLGDRFGDRFGDEQRMAGFARRTGLTPGSPLRALLAMTCARDFDAHGLASGTEEIAQKPVSFIPVLGTNQFAEAQRSSAGNGWVQAPFESRVHLDNEPLGVTPRHGNGSVFEEGAEGDSRLLAA